MPINIYFVIVLVSMTARRGGVPNFDFHSTEEPPIPHVTSVTTKLWDRSVPQTSMTFSGVMQCNQIPLIVTICYKTTFLNLMI